MIKKIFFVIYILFWVFFTQNIYAANIDLDVELDREVIFDFVANYAIGDIPDSYQYINLYYTDISSPKLYTNLQKIVYTWVLPNKKANIKPKSKLNNYTFYWLIDAIIDVDLSKSLVGIGSKNTTLRDIINVRDLISNNKLSSDITHPEDGLDILKTSKEKEQFKILLDIYTTLISEYYNTTDINKQQMIYDAIAGLVDSLWDRHTVYFPPTKNKEFIEDLSWEHEWIWAYVEMTKPWVFTILLPIPNWPAEKAWILPQDIVLKVDSVRVLEDDTVESVVANIKWPVWTTVVLTILRWDEELEIEVTRDKFVINDVLWESIWDSAYGISIRNFWDHVYGQFLDTLIDFMWSWDDTLVIDLRDNPGWYLDKVVDMLELLLPKWSVSVEIDYINWDFKYTTKKAPIIDLNEYIVYILVNWNTRSASEIMTWTLKEYFPNITILWEQTYWKGTVQTVREYSDGSSLKYTIASWATWLNGVHIDGLGIAPDIELSQDSMDIWDGVDTLLKYILDISNNNF